MKNSMQATQAKTISATAKPLYFWHVNERLEVVMEIYDNFDLWKIKRALSGNWFHSQAQAELARDIVRGVFTAVRGGNGSG